jgi:phenylacetate-CoA ligase
MPSRPTSILDRSQIAALQQDRLRELLGEIIPANPFYAGKFEEAKVSISSKFKLDDLPRLPFTTKDELLADQAAYSPYGRNLTYPAVRYTRMHQTSGTCGAPLRWLDTPESWQWVLGCWKIIYDMVEIRPGDRLVFPFSFGPFLGFWGAFEAATQLGLMCIPAGGMTSTARLRCLLDNDATVVLCTPTYALHLAETARDQLIDLAGSRVRAIIVAGEPGGSIPATRQRIEAAWGGRVFDHAGMTEIGPASVECSANPAGLHLLETEFIAEVLDPTNSTPVSPGEIGELVLTNLGRSGSPLLRYRTGDLVCPDPQPCPCGRPFLRFRGGLLGRTDDMIHLRGNNFYPSALENVIRRFPEVAEFRITVDHRDALPDLRIELEPDPGRSSVGLAERLSQKVRDELLFRAQVKIVTPGSLPRFEMKAKRVVRIKEN